jgi:hypothetical protein
MTERETLEETRRWRVAKIGAVLAEAGLPAYEMNHLATNPFNDPVRQPGYAAASWKDHPDCVFTEWIDSFFGHGSNWRYGCDRIMRALRDAGYTVEEPGACGPINEQIRTHDYMRVTRPAREPE